MTHFREKPPCQQGRFGREQGAIHLSPRSWSTVVAWSLETLPRGLDSMFFIEKKITSSTPMGKLRSDGNVALKLPETWLDRLFQGLFVHRTLGFTIPFISLHPWNHPNNKTLCQVRWANFRVISELTQNSWKSRKNEQFTPRRKPCCLITTSWEDLNVTNLTDPAQQRPRRWAGGEGDDSNYSQPEFSVKLELEKTTSEEMEKKIKTFNFSKDLVNSGTGCLPHGKQWNMSLLVLLGLGPIFHWTCHDYGRKGLSTLVLRRNWMVWDLLVENFILGPALKRAIARTEGQQRNWRFFFEGETKTTNPRQILSNRLLNQKIMVV